nr:hypothetical protein [uncultured Carboxylicivirga sp.]
MKIDLNNYEAYLLDYLEGTIDPEDKSLLLSFLDENPELKEDLDVSMDLVLPNAMPVNKFDKSSLKKHAADEYELEPIDYLYIKEQEEGLTNVEKEEQILLEPDESNRKAERKLFAISFLKPDASIHYGAKSKIKRFVFINQFSQLRIQQIAAVIAVLLIASAIWFTPKQYTKEATTVIADGDKITETENTDNSLLAKTDPTIGKTNVIIQSPPSKDSVMQIAKDPMGVNKQESKKQGSIQKERIETTKAKKLIALQEINVGDVEPVNGYELALNVMMPQYMSNNILSQELAEIYQVIEKDDAIPAKNLALVESGVKVLNFFSKDAVSLDKYYNEDGKLIGYNLQGNNLSVKRNAH